MWDIVVDGHGWMDERVGTYSLAMTNKHHRIMKKENDKID
jgi:hypothetical protein